MLERSQLHDYQVEAIEWMQEHEEGFLWLGLGDGKTVIALTAIAAMSGTALVVGTKRIIELTWPEEISKWEHLHTLSYASCAGTKKKREAAVASNPQILGVSYENLKWFYETYGNDREILVLDESSKMKAHNTKRLRKHVQFVPSFKRRYGLSATPAAESYLGLWGQAAAVLKTRPIGRTITEFRNTFTTQHYKGMFTEYVISKRNKRDIERRLAPHVFLVDDSRRPPLAAPTVIDHHVPWATTGAAEHYRSMEKELLVELTDKPISAASKGIAYNKCRQIASGFVYDGEKTAHAIDEEKIDAIVEEYEALGGDPVLVFYQYLWEKAQLLARLEGSEELEGHNYQRWNEGKIRCLVLHPASCGHGLNLQGVCRHVFWASLPWSLEHYLQANGRVHRQGQTRQVVIKHFLRSGTIEEDVLLRLGGKLTGMEELLERMRERQ